MACQLHAKAQETNGAATEAQGSVPPLPIPTSGSGDRLDQSGATRLGELLRGRALQRVLLLHYKLGGKKVRRHMLRARKRKGFGWKRWSSQWLYENLKLFNSYRVRRPPAKVAPAR